MFTLLYNQTLNLRLFTCFKMHRDEQHPNYCNWELLSSAKFTDIHNGISAKFTIFRSYTHCNSQVNIRRMKQSCAYPGTVVILGCSPTGLTSCMKLVVRNWLHEISRTDLQPPDRPKFVVEIMLSDNKDVYSFVVVYAVGTSILHNKILLNFILNFFECKRNISLNEFA